MKSLIASVLLFAFAGALAVVPPAAAPPRAAQIAQPQPLPVQSLPAPLVEWPRTTEIVWEEHGDPSPGSGQMTATGRWLPLPTSSVEVIEGDPPRVVFARDSKLREIGPVGVLDEPTERALGVRWDYQRPALLALSELTPGIPRENLLRTWPWSDQTIAELGRPALPVLDDAAAAHRLVASYHDEALVRIALRRLVGAVKLRDGQAGEGGRAVVMVALGRFEAVEAAARQARVGNEVLTALRAYHKDASDLLARALGALTSQWPRDINDAATWTDAERALVVTLGPAAERSLALLAEAKPEFASKVEWMLGEIRRRAADVVLKTFIAASDRASSLDDAVSVALCRPQVEAAIAARQDERARLAASPAEADYKRARDLGAALEEFSRLYLQSLQSPGGAVASNLEKYKRELAAGRNAREALVAELCALPATVSNPFGFCDELAVRRARESALAAKCRWHTAHINRREVDPAAGFDPVHKINPFNGGRAWDVQHRSEDIAAVLELRAAYAESVVPIALEAGRGYEFSYRVKALDTADGRRAHALTAQAAWLEFVPLDERGLPAFDLIHPRAAFEAAPFRYSRSGQWAAARHLATDADPSGWLNVRVAIPAVPRAIRGFTLRVVVQNILDEGAVYFDDLVLRRVSEGFADSFETGDVESANWTRLVDRDRGYMPYATVAFDEQQRTEGRRSLCIRPRGFNFQMTTVRTFTLTPGRDYLLEGSLRCTAMQSLRARLELIRADGVSVAAAPWRGDSDWITERLELGALPDTDQLRVRLTVAGPRPAYDAAVWVDALRLVETPALRWSLDAGTPGTARLFAVEAGSRPVLHLWLRGLPRSASRCRIEIEGRPAVTSVLSGGEAALPPIVLDASMGITRLRVELAQDGREAALLQRDLSLALMPIDGSSGLALDSRWSSSSLAEFGRALQPQWLMSELWEPGGAGRADARLARGPAAARRVAVLNALPDTDDGAVSVVERCGELDARKLAQMLAAAVKVCESGAQAFQLGPCFGPQAAPAPEVGLPTLIAAMRRAMTEGGCNGATQVIALQPRGLDALARVLAPRWAEAVRGDDGIKRALGADEVGKLASLAPAAILLREDERLNLCVPTTLAAGEMEAALAPWTTRIGDFEHPLGRDAAVIRERARALFAGGAFAGDQASRQFVTLQSGANVADKRLRLARLGFGPVMFEHRSDAEDLQSLLAWRTADRFAAETSPTVLRGLPADVDAIALRAGEGLRLALRGKGRRVLPLGAHVRALDFAGNETPCADDGAGNVTVELSDQPLMLLGADLELIETLETISCLPALRAETRAQELTLSLQNRFEASLDATVEVLLAGPLVEHARLADAQGRAARSRATALKLGAATLKPGAASEFKLSLRPLPDCPLRGGTLLLRLSLTVGARRYVITREVTPLVIAEIRVTGVQLIAGENGYEVVITAENTTAEAAEVQLTLAVTGHAGLARQTRLKLRAGATGEVRLPWARPAAERAAGADCDVGLTQSPGFRFDNTGWRLAPEGAGLAIRPR